MAARTISLHTAQQRMRAAVVQKATHAEHWLAEATAAEARGTPGYGLCLRGVAETAAADAFAAATAYQAQAEGRASLPLRTVLRRKVA